MAFIRFTDNTGQTVPTEKAITIFRVQQGLIKGTAQQQEFCKRVHKVYIARELAPKDYLAKYPQSDEQAAQVGAVWPTLAYKDDA